SFSGSQTVLIMSLIPGSRISYEYRLLATSKTSTMQKEIQQAGAQGFDYRGQIVFDTSFGGNEVVVIMERRSDAKDARYDFQILATTRTGTLQKELTDAGHNGYEFAGMNVGKTAFGGAEVVIFLRRKTSGRTVN
ncbi:MAG: hypothetical protein ACRD63_09040, partial [Pyrinomonadaceae bacterium]